MKKLYIAIVFFALQPLIFAQPFEWQWQNAKPVGNALYDVQALSSTRVIAFGTAGVEIISTDAGENWQRNIADASRRDIWGSYFFNATTGFAVGSGGLIMKTTDGGDTWVSKTSNTTNILYDIEFYDLNNGIATGAAGTVDRTSDGGETWTLSTATGTGSLYKVCIVNSSLVYAGNSSSSSPGYLLKSTNFGVSFSNVTPAQITSAVQGMYAADANNIWASTGSNGIVFTSNGGTSWAVQQADANAIYDIKFINSTTGFAVDSKGVVWSTVNTGTNWTSTQTSSVKQIRAVSQNSSILYLVGNCGNLYKSTNTGGSWVAKYSTVTQEQLRKMIFKGDYNGWTAESPSSGSSKLLATTDGGQTWTTRNTIPNPIYSISMPTNTTWYVSCSNNTIYKSTDGGDSFSSLTVPTTGATFWCMAFADSLNGYAGAAAGKFIKTTDGGASWTDISTPLNFGSNTVESIAIITKDIFYVAGLGSKLSKTTNGGSTFSALSPGIAGSFFSTKFRDANLGFVGAFGSSTTFVSRTTDAGLTWTPITLPSIPGGSIWDFAISGSNVWFATVNGDILYSTDEGATFNIGKKPMSSIIYNFAVSNNNLWLCGAEGAIVKGYANPFSYTLNLTAQIQGFTDAGTGLMIPDTITAELHNSISPYALIESHKGYVGSNGAGTYTFNSIANGTPYYIALKHRNGVETWSGTSNSFAAGQLNYDFASTQSQAYGSNLVQVGTKWCIYSGDVTQDGSVDIFDLSAVDNDVASFAGGYVPTDVNGDGSVDIFDLSIVDNNTALFVGKVTPSAIRLIKTHRMINKQ